MEMNCADAREAYTRLALAEERHRAEREVMRAAGSSPQVQGLEKGLQAAAGHSSS